MKNRIIRSILRSIVMVFTFVSFLWLLLTIVYGNSLLVSFISFYITVEGLSFYINYKINRRNYETIRRYFARYGSSFR